MKAALKNIIFDLGGVLLNIDYNLTEEAFRQLGFTNFAGMYSQFTADDTFKKLETGLIDSEEFYIRMKKAAGSQHVTEEQIETAWNKMLLTWRTGSVAFLRTLSSTYKIYLLSNTNAIHLSSFNKIFKDATGISNGIDHLFTKAYYSHKINLRKPNENVFEFVAKDANIKIEETLFVDDSANNIETARQMGFKTHLLLAQENIEHLNYNLF